LAKYYHRKDNLLILSVYIQPNAKQNEVVGLHDNDLKIKIKSRPIDGKANKELIKFLAQQFDIPLSKIKLASGENSRHKILHIDSPSQIPQNILQENS